MVLPHFDPLTRLTTEVGLGGPIAALGVLAADALLSRVLAPELRRGLKFPTALAWIYIAISIARCFTIGDASEVEQIFKVVAAVGLALAIAQTGFLVVVDFVLGRNGRKPLRPLIRYALLAITFLGAALVGLRAGGVAGIGVLGTGAFVVGGIGAAVAEILRQVGAGMLVQYSRPFEIGDTVQVLPMQMRGAVVQTSWRTTKMRGEDGLEYQVPNADLVTHTVINFGHGDRAFRREITFDAASDAQPAVVRRTVLQALREVVGVEATPAPTVGVLAFRDSGVGYRVRYWTKRAADPDGIDDEVRTRIWYAFSRAQLSFPAPIRELQLKEHVVLDHTPQRAEDLAQCKLFAGLPEPAIREVAALGQERAYAEGEVVVLAGEAGTEMHVLLEGEVSVQAPLDRRELIRLGRGEYFGEMSLVTGALRAATVVTTQPTRTFVIDERSFRAMIERHPHVMDTLGEILASRQADLAALVEQRPAESERSRALKSLIMDRLKGIFGFGGNKSS